MSRLQANGDAVIDGMAPTYQKIPNPLNENASEDLKQSLSKRKLRPRQRRASSQPKTIKESTKRANAKTKALTRKHMRILKRNTRSRTETESESTDTSSRRRRREGIEKAWRKKEKAWLKKHPVTSHEWDDGVSGVTVVRTPEEIAEVHERQRQRHLESAAKLKLRGTPAESRARKIAAWLARTKSASNTPTALRRSQRLAYLELEKEAQERMKEFDGIETKEEIDT